MSQGHNSAPPVSGDAMEGIETNKVETNKVETNKAETNKVEVFQVKTQALDNQQRNMVLAQNPDLYVMLTGTGTTTWVQPEQIFELRGQDHPRSKLPEGMAGENKARSIIIGQGTFAGKHMETSSELAQ
jgi:hypothetical protein